MFYTSKLYDGMKMQEGWTEAWVIGQCHPKDLKFSLSPHVPSAPGRPVPGTVIGI